MIIGCDFEGRVGNQHNISVSIIFVCESEASGKMVSGAMVQGAGRSGRSGLA
jgi:hypothetical protein